MLVARGLGKRYGRTTALDGFDLHIRPGEIVGLVGHNGAGKTTFVEMVAGLIRPDSGELRVGGVDVIADPAGARSFIGMAPQEIALYPSLTVLDNLRLFGGVAGLDRRAVREAVTETAQALGLTEVLRRRVGLLSGGQKRRVQAATAILHRPRLLLLDEPTAGADPDTRHALLGVVRGHAEAGAAVCYTTHYLPELSDLGASIAVAARGRVIARGDQAGLLARLPSEVRVAFADGESRTRRTTDPSRALAEMLAAGGVAQSVDIRRPSLDDLYRSLGAGDVAA